MNETQNFEVLDLAMAKVKKVNIADTYSSVLTFVTSNENLANCTVPWKRN
jgi:hypothetical protein